MKKVFFIVNPISGGKDKSWILAAVGKYLDGSLYRTEICQTECQGQAGEMARDSDADIVVAVGGDGTVSEVAHALVGSQKALGIIPCGSGDGLAFHLGLSRIPTLAVKTLNDACVTQIDVAFINERPFLCTAGMGLDANVSADFACSSRRGLPRYISLAWDEWRNKDFDRYTIRSDNGESWSGNAVLVTVANANQWGNQARIAPMASLQDGLLDVVVVRPFNTLEIPGEAIRLMAGLADTSSHLLYFRGAGFHIERSRPGALHLDGEPLQEGESFDIGVRKGALNVVVPSSRLHKI